MTGSPMDRDLHRPCPVCGCKTAVSLHRGGFVLPDEHPLSGDVNVVSCSHCGFCFNDTLSRAADYDLYYAEMSKYAEPTISTGAGMTAEDRRRLDSTAEQIWQFSSATTSSIVDIGCGAGGLLGSLKRRGFTDLHGIDPSPRCAEFVSASGHHGLVGTLTQGMASGRRFNGAILCHVLEHVYDLTAASQCIKDCLAPDGWLYVEVPDARRYGACLIAPFQDFNLEHINHFSIDSLASFLGAAGWRVEERGEKTLSLPAGNEYPAIYAFARRSGAAEPQADRLTKESLADYIERSDGKLRQIEDVLRSTVTNRPVFVWGVGQLTMRLLGESSLHSADIIAFIDSNPIYHGRRLHGRPIIAPAEVASTANGEIPILLCSLVNLESIEGTVQRHDIRNPLIRLIAKEKST